MLGMMRGVAVAAVLAVLSTGAWAQSDDFVAVCTAVNKDALQAKVCDCMSEKVKDDRPTFIATMKMLNEAQTKGTEPDPSKMKPEEVQALTAVMNAMASCFQ